MGRHQEGSTFKQRAADALALAGLVTFTQRRLPREEVDARNQRLKRAMDLSLKRDYLPAEVQAVQAPFLHYAKATLDAVVAENAEKAALGAGKDYDRQIP